MQTAPLLTVRIRRHAPAASSQRARAIRRQFDIGRRSTSLSIDADVPAAAGTWQIGAIVGPSGSGKSHLLREAFGNTATAPYSWRADRPVIDCVGKSADEAAAFFAAVGLGSVPAWLRPFHLLSAGEQFRASLAFTLAFSTDLVAIDEFTSSLDRVVARSACAALSRFIRRSQRQLVVAGCHEDILPWLCPEWTLRLPEASLDWRRLRRPRLVASVFASCRSLWPRFAPHHYLNSGLHPASRCYAAFVEDRPAAFCATLNNLGRANWRRITRLVVLPEYQGLGLGGKLADAVGELETAAGCRLSIVTSHPALLAGLARSSRWRQLYVRRGRHEHHYRHTVTGGGARSRVSYEFLP